VGETLSALWNLWRDATSFPYFPPLSIAALTVGQQAPAGLPVRFTANGYNA